MSLKNVVDDIGPGNENLSWSEWKSQILCMFTGRELGDIYHE